MISVWTKCREFATVTVEATDANQIGFFFRVQMWEFYATDFYKAQYSSRNYYRYSLIYKKKNQNANIG